MPGFAVGRFNNDPRTGVTKSPLVRSSMKYYYNYTWYIPKVAGVSSLSNPVLLQLKDATAPSFTVGVEKYIGGSLEYKFAKNVSWDDVKIAWYDTVGMMAIITYWRQSVWRYDIGLRPASSYKATTEIVGYLPTGKKEYGWTLYGSWPSTIKSGELTYSNSDVKTVEVSLTYDYAVEEYED